MNGPLVPCQYRPSFEAVGRFGQDGHTMKHPAASASIVLGAALLAYPLLGFGADPATGTEHASSVFFAARTAPIIPAHSASGTAAPANETSEQRLDRRTKRAMDRLRSLLGPNADVSKIRPPSALTKPPMDPYKSRGVYLVSGRAADIDGYLKETVGELKKANGGGIVFDVKGSRVYFDTTSGIAKELNLVKPIEDLPAIVKLLHDNGIYVVGRFIAIKDDGFTTAYPAASVRHPTSNAVLSATWIDPSNEYAQQYNMEVLCDLAKSGIDEVNFDYIRFSTENYGALGVYSGQQKADKVFSFIKKARETIDRCGPSTKLGISSYAILGWNYPVNLETLGQDVVRFAPYLDVISPMAYPATFSEDGGYWNPAKHGKSRMYWLVYRTLTGYKDLLADEDKGKLRPWIQGYGVTKQNVIDQMHAVYDAGYCGFQFWNAGNNYGPVYAALAADTPPENCRID